MRKFLIASACLAFSATSANSATLIVDSNGILTGATGVTVGTNTYNVSFLDGTCAGVFGSCQVSSFDFNSVQDATLAAQALLDQVFIDSSAGSFDSDVANILGCGPATSCGSLIPYAISPNSSGYDAIGATNGTGNILDGPGLSGASFGFDSTTYTSLNFASFTKVTAALPEPSSWGMMLTGFGLIGGAMRSRRRLAANLA